LAHDILVSQLYTQDRNRISTTRFPHRATWDYFKSYLPAYFMCCPNVVQDTITTDINDLIQQFWRMSTDEVVDIFSLAMCRLREILQVCLDIMFLLGLPLTITHRYCSIAGTIQSGTLTKNILLQRSLINYFPNPDVWASCCGIYLVS
jgi:hypothetical protein